LTTPTVTELQPQAGYDLTQQDPRALLIDVRSHMEFLFIGHPVGAINIPWIDEPDWVLNPSFVREVRQLVLGGLSHEQGGGNETPIILICRSGKRSLEAGHVLMGEGFHRVYNIAGGFEGELDEQHHRSTINGWRHAGLPWAQC
jgi:rhodanese-related sulfurtransferase